MWITPFFVVLIRNSFRNNLLKNPGQAEVNSQDIHSRSLGDGCLLFLKSERIHSPSPFVSQPFNRESTKLYTDFFLNDFYIIF